MVDNLKLIKKSFIINMNYIFQEELNYSIPENDTIEAYMKLYNSLEEKKQLINIYINKNKSFKNQKKEEKNLIEKVKIVKGAKDCLSFQMVIRNIDFEIITKIFKKRGAVEINIPIFELKEILIGKYGKDSKLICDLKNQDGEEI